MPDALIRPATDIPLPNRLARWGRACLDPNAPGWKVMIGLVAWIGSGARLREYLAGRTLWLDEAALAINLVRRTPGELFRPLDYDQGAPIGFLLIQKLFVSLLGGGELALRLWPLLAGIGALLLFRHLLSRLVDGQILSPFGAVVAMVCLACFKTGTYYWVEVKQYSTDMLATALLLNVALWMLGRSIRWKEALLLGGVGGGVIWLSHPAIFVVAGIGAALFFAAMQKRNGRGAVLLALVGGAVAASFLAEFFLFLTYLRNNEFLHRFWRSGFPPEHFGAAWISWAYRCLLRLYSNMLWMRPMRYVLLAATVLGSVQLWRRHKMLLHVIGWIGLAALAASVLRQYPIAERLALYLAPLLALLIGGGVSLLSGMRFKIVSLLALGIGMAIIARPLPTTAWRIVAPLRFEQVAAAIRFVSENQQRDDTVYVYPFSVYPFIYYTQVHPQAIAITGEIAADDHDRPDELIERFKQFRGRKRVWFILSHLVPPNVQGATPRGEPINDLWIKAQLDQLGRRRQQFRIQGAAAFLYDMSSPTK